MKKSFFELIDFYSLFSLLCLWASSWILMFPFQIQTSALLHENFWGAFISFFGFVKTTSVNVQQLPDFLSGFLSLCVILTLHFRKIIFVTKKFTVQDKNAHQILYVFFNIFSIIVHTLFFTILIKIFVFPATGKSDFLGVLREKISFTILFCIILSGILFGEKFLSKIFLILFVFVLVFFNLKNVSEILGVQGFFALIFAEIAFYLEFYSSFVEEKISFSVKKIKSKLNKKIYIAILCVFGFLFLLFPSILISKVLKLESGYKGLKWGSTISDVRDWASKNTTNFSFKKCEQGHFGGVCYKLKLKNAENSKIDFLEFQFQNEKLICVVESFFETEESFENLSEESFLRGTKLDSEIKKNKGKKYEFSHYVLPSIHKNAANGTKILELYSALIKSPVDENETKDLHAEKFQFTVKYFGYDYNHFEDEENIDFRF